MLYAVGDFFQPVAVFCCQCFYCLLHGNCVGVGGIGGKKDAIGRAGHKGHKADDNNDAKCHADAYGNGRNKAVEAGEKVSYGRAHCSNHLAGVCGGFLEMKDNKCTVLATIAEADADIDTARATAAKERAEQRLASKSEDIDTVRAENALKRAVARLRTTHKL